MTTVLETEHLTREFGALVAVDDVSVAIDDADITSIIGPNGAGKTTFYNLLAGQLDPTEGRIAIRPRRADPVPDGGTTADADGGTTADADGGTDANAGTATDPDDAGLVDVTGMEPFEINRLGLARAFQINNVFERLTVLENVRVARISREGRTLDVTSVAASDDELNEQARRVLELTNLEGVADTRCANLSHGDVRKVEIALALGTDPSVVLLDEPTAGMNATETRRMVELIGELDETTDTTFLVTEHDMEVVLGISDRILVFDNGRLIADGTPDEVMADERVREAYLGGEG
ncbi:ABC transporter ATP-binding protein [Halorussus sp. MSC15.2]|uniref:ABC transporter ATP-binding protein n=1 Tax=Halorussus sp. MSC15.2 TaxID=2283638 RepID=UPI0013D2B0EC|nr:ABC transporter ATP-binding protein [Halorussus sp. MSC15.2]NEU57781.1 ABC transporter ATP-binding protein [Halorussus sp. MSC15.2]